MTAVNRKNESNEKSGKRVLDLTCRNVTFFGERDTAPSRWDLREKDNVQSNVKFFGLMHHYEVNIFKNAQCSSRRVVTDWFHYEILSSTKSPGK